MRRDIADTDAKNDLQELKPILRPQRPSPTALDSTGQTLSSADATHSTGYKKSNSRK